MSAFADTFFWQGTMKRTVVVAFGGNAISTNSKDTIADEFRNTRTSLQALEPLIQDDISLVLTHGNGPQVGKKLRRVELALTVVPETPLGVLVADTQGSIGYMIEQTMMNWLVDHKKHVPVATVLTQVLVDPKDPALVEPTKFVGQFFTTDEAMRFRQDLGWILREDAGRGWRRVVGSPQPLEIANILCIKQLLEAGSIVIAAGGGGIPCFLDPKGHLEGLDAVIDKDRASALLANQLGAEELLILTGVHRVCIHFGSPEQKNIDQLTVAEAKEFLAQGHFPAGSMGPKMEAAIQFIEGGGKRCVITDFDGIEDALSGTGGTFLTA
jgi:carbamate kinase